jgi:hypothetical protein
MDPRTSKRLNITWLALVAISVMYLWIDDTAEDGGVHIASTAVSLAAIGLGLLKFRVIMREFMDVRHAPRMMRRLTDLLVAVIGVALLASYAAGKASA